jgi:pimeloyl-ACP methyl ester carboxylesterase
MPTRAEELREAIRLAVEATLGVTNTVQQMHHAIGGGPAILGRPLEGLVKLISFPAYAGVKLVTQLVGAGLDVVLAQLDPVLGPGGDSPEQDAVVGALNGVVGDVLAERKSSLAITTGFRRAASTIPPVPQGVSGRLLVLVHGSSATDGCWARKGQHHGEALERALGFTWVALRYNSGKHVSTNGHEFADALQALVEAWPVPVTELVIVAHSMGGLVTRAACRSAEARTLGWRPLLEAFVTLGTPHQGAPLERIGNIVGTMLGISRYSAPLERLSHLRSAGVTDLRFGLTKDEEWQGGDRFAPEADPRTAIELPKDVACFAIAATMSKDPTSGPLGDGLVPVDSALGRHEKPELNLAFPPERTRILTGLAHMDLLDDANVSAQLIDWLGRV